MYERVFGKMVKMKKISISNFDLKLDEILYLINPAIGELRELETDLDKKQFIRLGGKIVYELWEVRDKIHTQLPYLTPNLGQEMNDNMPRYEELNKLYSTACNLLENGDLEKAQTAFKELWQQAEYGYFRFFAEVFLYECQQRMQGNFDELNFKFYQTFEQLNEIYNQAQQLEQQQQFQAALEIYQHLVKISKYQQFEFLGMSGCYRCQKALNA